MMKYFKFVLIALASFVMLQSCFSEYSNQEKYTIIASFTYSGATADADSLIRDNVGQGGYGWYDVGFMQKANQEKDYLGGFMISTMCGRAEATETVPLNYFRSYLLGKDKGNCYSVFYDNASKEMMPEHSIMFLAKSYGTCTVSGCYVANSEKVAHQIKENFQDGDGLVVRAKGYLADKLTGKASIKLAKFTSEKDSIVSKWTPFDLQALGNVDAIDFEVISTNPAVEPYFCMDNFVAQIDIKY